MAGAQQRLVDLGVGSRVADAADGGGLTDVVDLADERQHRAGDVGEGDQLAVDGEAAGHHPVVRDELFEQFRDRRAGPGDPALGVQETALLFARQIYGPSVPVLAFGWQALSFKSDAEKTDMKHAFEQCGVVFA